MPKPTKPLGKGVKEEVSPYPLFKIELRVPSGRRGTDMAVCIFTGIDSNGYEEGKYAIRNITDEEALNPTRLCKILVSTVNDLFKHYKVEPILPPKKGKK